MTPQPMLDWIAGHVTGDVTGRCREVTAAMVEAFPELRRVRGHYFCPFVAQAFPHWWCELTVNGQVLVVDPTAAQFPSNGLGLYEEHTGPEPTGRCPNCGDYAYDGKYFCSDACACSYERYITEGF